MKVDATALPGGIREMIREITQQSLDEISRAEFSSTIYLFNSAKRSFMDFDIGDVPPELKDLHAVFVKNVAQKYECDLVVSLMDGWGIPNEDIDRYKEILEEYGAFANYPNRRSVFVVYVEAPSAVYYGSVYQNADKSFPPLTIEKMSAEFAAIVRKEGRYSSLLPQQVLQ